MSITLQSQTPKVRQWQKNEHTPYKIVSSESSCINFNFSVASFMTLTSFQSLFLVYSSVEHIAEVNGCKGRW